MDVTRIFLLFSRPCVPSPTAGRPLKAPETPSEACEKESQACHMETPSPRAFPGMSSAIPLDTGTVSHVQDGAMGSVSPGFCSHCPRPSQA